MFDLAGEIDIIVSHDIFYSKVHKYLKLTIILIKYLLCARH